MPDLNIWLPQQFLAPNFNLPTFDLLMPQLNFPWLTKKKLQEGSGLNSDVVEGLQDITSSFLTLDANTIWQNRTLKSNIASSADTDSSNLFYKNGKVYADVDLSAYSATTNDPLKNIQNIQAIKKAQADAQVEGSNEKVHIEGSGLLKTANAAQIAGMGGDILNSVLPKKREYEGDKGNITAGIDTAYDTIANVANSFGPLGLAIGGIMKAGAGAGKVMNALGTGTDAMTTADAILGSNFLNMIPISWINGWGGSKTRSFTKDDEAFDEVGASYTGSNKTIDDALNKANKKYGLFSSHARKKANELIDEADRQLSIIQSIADNERNRLAMASVMTDIYGSDYAFKLKGGYNPSAMRIGKEGMKIGYLNIARNWLNDLSKVSEPILPTIITPIFYDEEPEKMQLGGIIPTIINIPQLPTFIDIIEIPEEPEYTSSVIEVLDIAKFQDGGAIEQEEQEEPNMKELIKQSEKLNPRFILRLHEFPKVCKVVNENGDVIYGSHALEVFTTNDGKAIVLPTIVEDKNGLLVLLSKKEAKLHAKANDDYIVFDNEQDALYFTQHYKEWYPRYMSQRDDAVDEFRTKEANKDELFGDLEDVEAYQKGGEINVIPEGSLHAHKHNMDVEGITKKGIPVVSEEPNGELKQQAEIERAEIIFRLEVTQKLEELYNIYESEDTSKEEKEDAAFEAGKLLAKEINFNTVDNTNDLL